MGHVMIYHTASEQSSSFPYHNTLQISIIVETRERLKRTSCRPKMLLSAFLLIIHVASVHSQIRVRRKIMKSFNNVK